MTVDQQESAETYVEEPREEAQVVMDVPKEEIEPSEKESPEESQNKDTPSDAAYQANYQYRVLKEEKEIPDWARSLIKDPDSEKSVRELFEKADGLEVVKSHRDQLQQTVEKFETEWTPYIQETQAALQAARDGDLRTFFDKVGLSDEQIFKYTQTQLELRKDPARLAAYEQSRQHLTRNQELEQRYSQLEQGYQQMAIQQREMELQSAMTRPENRDAVTAFEERLGPGSFRSECIRLAQGLSAAQKRDVPVEEVVSHVIKISGWTPAMKQQPPPAQTSPAPRSGPRETKTLPNISGKGTSPAKRIPKSIDDLKQLAKEMAEE